MWPMQWKGSVLLTLVIFAPTLISAQMAISEVMYDLPTGSDSGREWVEIYNGGTSSVKLTDWRLLEGGTNHKITAVSGGENVQPDSYAVIAADALKFRTDWPQFSGQLFDSTFSLNNTGETISIHDASPASGGASSTAADTVAYQSSWGAAGDGNSLNRELGTTSFAPRSPIPGASISSVTIKPPSKPTSPQKTAKETSSVKTPDTTEGFSPPAIPDLSSGSAPTSEVVLEEMTSSPQSSNYIWWFAAAGIAAIAGASIVFAQKFSKNEWDIVEENETDS